jgi:hypothetical protein
VGEVIGFPKPDIEPPHFCISAIWEDGRWQVDVIDFHDKSMSTPDMFRDIAEALFPIAGGLVSQAEAEEPTDKGFIVSNLSIFSSGIIDLRTQPLDNAKRRAWFGHALDTIKGSVLGKKKHKRKA